MATSHLMTGTYFPHFDLDSSIFNKNKVFYRVCMWLQLSQIKKNSPKETRERAFIYYADVTKIRKTHVGHVWLFI